MISLSEVLNFNAASLVSYIILILLCIDAEREMTSKRKRRRKFFAVISAMMFIVIFLQILRGERESLGLIVGLMALYLTGPVLSATRERLKSIGWRRMRKLIVPAGLVIVLFIGLGAARYTLSEPYSSSFNLWETFVSGWEQNTWTAVLLTNLGITAQCRYGPMEYFYGQTYLHYVLSLPPGIVTNAVGIERPLEATRGPNWWFVGLSAGGIHPVVVPFKNFGILGVFVILCIYGFLIARFEMGNTSNAFWSRLMHGAVVTSSFLWFWYGDMNIIRGLMAAILLGAGYRVWVSWSGSLNRSIRVERETLSPFG
jgi:hypothetical protein